MRRRPGGATVVAGVAGNPVAHSLSPVIHNAWLDAADIDAVYVAFAPAGDGFKRLVEGFRGGVIRGLNVTAPFKETALTLADSASDGARRAGAANLMIFEADGSVTADNTDGEGLLAALAWQAPGFDPTVGPIAILGGGGAARGATMAMLEAGAPGVRLVARSPARAATIRDALGERVEVMEWAQASRALDGATAVINATPLGMHDSEGPEAPLASLAKSAVVMDMIYRPLKTRFLEQATQLGLITVDGLAMLIGQAAPSFSRLFGVPPPRIDVRSIAAATLDAAR